MLFTQEPGGSISDSAALLRCASSLDRAIEAGAWTITNVHAPAGFDKTTLLRTWVARLLERGMLAQYVDLSLVGCDPHALSVAICRKLSVAGAPMSSDQERLATRTADLLEGACVGVLVLDHYPAGHAALDAFVAALAARSKAGLHLAIGSRVPVIPPIGEDIGRFTFATLSVRDLALTPGEIGALTPAAVADRCAEIHAITDGWPWAVISLTAVLNDRPDTDAAALLDFLMDQDGAFAPALWREVLGVLPEQDLELLTQTSFLRLLNPDIVAAVAAGDGAWRSLDRLRQIGLLTPQQDARFDVGLQCHAVIRALLLRRLRARGEAQMKALHHRAAGHFMQRGDLRDALHHAVAAEDADLATEVFLKAGGVTIGVRDGCAALQESLDLLPSAALSHPRIRAAVAFCMIKSGRVGVGLEILRDLASPQFSDALDPLLIRDVRLVESLAVAFGVSGIEAPRSDSAPRPRRSPSTETTLMRGGVYNLRCLEAFKQGRLDHALVCADTAVYFYQAASALNGVAHVRLHSARIHRIRGDAARAAEDLRQAKQLSIETGAPDLSCIALADMQIGAMRADEGEVMTAALLCAAAMPRLERGERHWEALYEGYLILSTAKAFAAQTGSDDDVLRSGLRLARRNGCRELEAMLQLRLLRDDVLSGAITPGAAAIALEAIPMGAHWMLRQARTCLSAFMLAEGDAIEDGLALLDDAREECLSSGFLKSAVEFSLDKVVMLHRAGRRAAAITSAWEALSVAEPGNFVGPFVERRDFIHAVLVEAQVEQRGPRAYSARANFGAKVLGRLFAHDEGRAPPLSARERAIMDGLAAKKSNKEIARLLNVSPETVRFHLKSLYSKLRIQVGRRNRQIAADFARELQENATDAALPLEL